jgi:zinc/manganese transport system ATP-binding protein
VNTQAAVIVLRNRFASNLKAPRDALLDAEHRTSLDRISRSATTPTLPQLPHAHAHPSPTPGALKPDGGVQLDDVTVRYGRRTALESVQGSFAPGSLTAVVGANGAGKSTLLMAVAGAVRLARGAVACPARAQGRLAFLPQLAAIDRSFPFTVEELVALGGWREFGVFRGPSPALRARAEEAAATVGLAERLRRRVSELSEGEFRRALFARLILQDAAVILLDEPFAAVDTATTVALLGQLMQWHEEGRTVIAVLHDLAIVRTHFPETLVLARHCLAWDATEAALPAMAA